MSGKSPALPVNSILVGSRYNDGHKHVAPQASVGELVIVPLTTQNRKHSSSLRRMVMYDGRTIPSFCSVPTLAAVCTYHLKDWFRQLSESLDNSKFPVLEKAL
jgi:hypothetical protein